MSESVFGEETCKPSFDREGWRLVRRQFHTRDEGFYESLFALSTGLVGLRFTADPLLAAGNPGCFHARLYGPGLTVAQQIVNIAHPGFWRLFVGGRPLSATNGRLIKFEQWLRLDQAQVGLLLRVADDRNHVTDFEQHYFLPAHRNDMFVCRYKVRPLGHDAPVVLQTGLDWSIGNGDFGGQFRDVRLHHLSLTNLDCAADNISFLSFANRGTPQELHVGLRLFGAEVGPLVHERGRLLATIEIEGGAASEVTSVVLFGTGTLANRTGFASTATEALSAHDCSPFNELAALHRGIWASRWRQAAALEGPEDDAVGLRFAEFQVLQAVDYFSDITNPPARGLTSEYHSGHLFFNSELFVLPCLASRFPDAARKMLRHRIETLPAAVQFAAATEHVGARYPEEADFEGRPTAPHRIHDIFTGETSYEESGKYVKHISALVVWAYDYFVRMTGDKCFHSKDGAKMLVYCARYLADLMAFDSKLKRRGAKYVMCFDEFHFPVNHHTATNALSRWALSFCAGLFDGDTGADADLPDGEERTRWRTIAAEVHIPAADRSGVLPVFEGYFDLPDATLTLPAVDSGRLPELDYEDCARANRLLPFETQITKQADVLLLLSLLPSLVEPDQLAANLEYYEKRTAHSSSLSMMAHAVAAARLGDAETARRLFLASVRYNLDFVPRTDYSNGLHLGAFAGAWLTLFRGFAGVEGLDDGRLSVAPKPLPRQWQKVAIPFMWRGRKLIATLCQKEFVLEYVSGDASIALVHREVEYKIASGSRWTISIT